MADERCVCLAESLTERCERCQHLTSRHHEDGTCAVCKYSGGACRVAPPAPSPDTQREAEIGEPGCYICGASLTGKDGDWCAEFHGPFIAREIADLTAKLHRAEVAQRYLDARKRGGR